MHIIHLDVVQRIPEGLSDARMPIRILSFYFITEGLGSKVINDGSEGMAGRKLDELASIPLFSASHISEEEVPTLVKTNCYASTKHVLLPKPGTSCSLPHRNVN